MNTVYLYIYIAFLLFIFNVFYHFQYTNPEHIL